MKRLSALILALILALSCTLPVIAFDDVDADNETLNAAVEAMNSLKIIQGYEDGSFRPEKMVSRAEMAKMMIVARGLEQLAGETPSFTDCNRHWAAGYISLANDLGIINGRGNGIFDPDSAVTYQEAAVMMLRALGYTNETINGGKSDSYNAANYKTKALNLRILDDKLLPKISDGSNRGDIALMLNTTLQQRMVVTDNGRPRETDTKLIDKVVQREEHFYVSAEELSKKHLVDLSGYLYQDISVYIQNSCVVYVVKSNSVTYNGALSDDGIEGQIHIKFADGTLKDLKTADSVSVFYNGAENQEVTNPDSIVCDEAKVVLNADGKVCGIIYDQFDPPILIGKEYVTGNQKFAAYILPLGKNGKIDLSKITVTGDATSLEDIKKNDVVEAARPQNKSTITLAVTRNPVEGKITKIEDGKYYIDGVQYTSRGSSFELGNEGTFYLDKSGSIAFFRAKNPEAPEDMGYDGSGEDYYYYEDDDYYYDDDDYYGDDYYYDDDDYYGDDNYGDE